MPSHTNRFVIEEFTDPDGTKSYNFSSEQDGREDSGLNIIELGFTLEKYLRSPIPREPKKNGQKKTTLRTPE